METVVVAFEGEKNGRRLKELLESSGTAACLLCRTADQVKRLVRQQRLTAVVCGYKFPDGTAEELAGELPGFCTVLLLAPRGLLEELLRLGEEAGALLPPRRSREEREVVERAKERLMARNGMTEEEAHRALRRRSMDCRIPLADAARMLLDGERPAP
ncbi:ANTAR domain-containing protein [Flavonifractor plautii]